MTAFIPTPTDLDNFFRAGRLIGWVAMALYLIVLFLDFAQDRADMRRADSPTGVIPFPERRTR